MSLLCLFLISGVAQFCQTQALRNAKSANKQPEVETFTTILLEDEAYSLESFSKKLHKQPNKIPSKESEKTSPGKQSMTNHHLLKEDRVKTPDGLHGAKLKPSLSTKIAEDKKGNSQKPPSKVARHQQRSNYAKKKLKKRNFDAAQRGYVWNSGENNPRYEAGNRHIQNYRFAVQPTDSIPTNLQVVQNTESLLGLTTVGNRQTSEKLPKEDVPRSSDDLSWENKENYGPYRPARQPQTDTVPRLWTRNESALNLGGYNSFSTYQPPVNTTVKWSVTTYPSFYASSASPATIVVRNLPPSDHPSKSEKEKLEEQLKAEEVDGDDTVIEIGCSCDQTINDTCWMTREIGDVVTLSVKIESSKSPNSFQIRWLRVYHIYNSKKGKPLEIEPGKLPWNMVSGSEGRELRLNPVTNTDLDPNYIVAKVFLLTKRRGKVLFTHMKKLIFRIDIPIIDMGTLYAGEEVSIHLENFISLPERGNLLFDWCLERRPHESRSLPSNVKISNSGRSVVLKELKKGRFGVLNCVVYSSTRYSVAKRRFNILNVAESVKRRSTDKHPLSEKLSLKRSLRCRRVIRRSQEKAMQRLEAGAKPKSRQKRFKRVGRDEAEIDCEPMRKKIYSRWIRSLFGYYTTTDPRLMPLDKLFELSEEGDGTLDDIIPHEVHYVESQIRLVNGTSGERSVGQSHTPRNCTSDIDCGQHAVCAVPHHDSATDQGGHCFCRLEFYGDGITCQKIPSSSHREKRLRRDARKEFAVPEHLFYEPAPRRTASTTSAPTETRQEEENLDIPPKVRAFEEEESFLLSDCLDDRDCSTHANCVQPSNGHPYCTCRPGFRGNGLFCWEIIDYVPPEEEFVPEDELNPRGHTGMPENHLASRPPSPDELEEV